MLQTVVHMLYKKDQMILQGLTIEIIIFVNEITFMVGILSQLPKWRAIKCISQHTDGFWKMFRPSLRIKFKSSKRTSPCNLELSQQMVPRYIALLTHLAQVCMLVLEYFLHNPRFFKVIA